VKISVEITDKTSEGQGHEIKSASRAKNTKVKKIRSSITEDENSVGVGLTEKGGKGSRLKEDRIDSVKANKASKMNKGGKDDFDIDSESPSKF